MRSDARAARRSAREGSGGGCRFLCEDSGITFDMPQNHPLAGQGQCAYPHHPQQSMGYPHQQLPEMATLQHSHEGLGGILEAVHHVFTVANFAFTQPLR